MKIVRIICLLVVSLLALCPLGAVLAQEEEQEEYELILVPSGGRYDTIGRAGEAREFSVNVVNLGTEAITNITFSSIEPAGWTIGFSPDKLDLLETLESQEVSAIITPPEDIEAGVYMISLRALGEEASSEKLDIKVDVKVVQERLELNATYPTLKAVAGENFVFEVEFYYIGKEARDFNLLTTAPQGWEVYMTPPYEKEKKISAVRLEPLKSAGNKIRVVVSAPFWPLPEPGEYKITLGAVSLDGWEKSIEFKAIITARYTLLLVPATERLDTTAMAGKDNYFSLEVGNLGTAAINNINFSSTKPQGWTIEFTPDKVDLLEAFDSQTIDVNIKPPPETIAGDYSIALRASGEQTASQELAIRVTIETPTVWGWVGVGIIFVVIAGLVVIFMRFSRR